MVSTESMGNTSMHEKLGDMSNIGKDEQDKPGFEHTHPVQSLTAREKPRKSPEEAQEEKEYGVVEVHSLAELPPEIYENNIILNAGHREVLRMYREGKLHPFIQKEISSLGYTAEDIKLPQGHRLIRLKGEKTPDTWEYVPMAELLENMKDSPATALVGFGIAREELGNRAAMLIQLKPSDLAYYDPRYERPSAQIKEQEEDVVNRYTQIAREGQAYYMAQQRNAQQLLATADICFQKHGVYEKDQERYEAQLNERLKSEESNWPGISRAQILKYTGIDQLLWRDTVKGNMERLREHAEKIDTFYRSLDTKPSEQN